MLNKTLTGIYPNDNLDVLLKALEATKEYKVERSGDRVILDTVR
jgi:ferric-dicitrate binding protein FerR (iron transport regulator)